MEQEQQVSPEMQGKVDDYTSILMNLMHSKNTRDDVINMLKSSKDPYITIPQAAMAINDSASNQIKTQGGKGVDIETQFMASQYLVQDLMEIGNAYQLFQVSQEDFGPLLQDSMQMYIERGLKDGSIDPIELQLTAESAMTENQRIGGQYLAQQCGLGHAPNQQQVIQQTEARTKRDTMAQVQKQQADQAKAQRDQMVQQALMGGK